MNAEPGALLRDRTIRQGYRVTFAELLFDVVFVFTIIQLSHALAAHFTPLGVFETGLLVLAIWWTWIFTTWFTNWLDPDRAPVRVALFVTMFFSGSSCRRPSPRPSASAARCSASPSP